MCCFSSNCTVPRSFQRLWGLTCDKQYPLIAEEITKGRSTGLNRTNAAATLKRDIQPVDHSPMLQNVMQHSAANYESPCWLRGLCRTENASMYWQQGVLHRVLMKEIKKQLHAVLPITAAKEILTSGDVVVAVRFFCNDNSPALASTSASTVSATATKCTLWMFQLAKVCLRPEVAVLVSLEEEPSASADFSGDPESSRVVMTSFASDKKTGFRFTTTWDLCASLLRNLSQAKGPGMGVIWCDVLQQKLLYLCRSFRT